MTEQEAIDKALKEGGGWIEFTGQNCDDYRASDDNRFCGGWDGESRRCDCGNRRVNWDFFKDEKGEIVYAYGLAY